MYSEKMIETEKPDNADELISAALDSEEVNALLATVHDDQYGLEERASSAIVLFGPENVETIDPEIDVSEFEITELGTRVDIVYTVYPETEMDERPEQSFNLQQFEPVDGKRETVGYLREGNALLTEYYTNEEMDGEVSATDYDGDVILDTRDFDSEDIL